jgi:homoserine O-acetyltransferase
VDPAQVHVETDFVAVDNDQIVPTSDIHCAAEALGARCRVHHITSSYGHDAFLKEPDRIDAILRSVLETGDAA